MSDFELSVAVLLQFAVLLTACRVVGWLVRPFGQPQVVAEMITGVLLGPSLLGWLAPELFARVFPAQSLSVIYCIAQIGLVLYMFLVGLELDVERIRKRARSAVAVSAAGILTPFALGAALSWALAGRFDLFAPGVARWEAAVFLGSAMSITAFPMLARIISERGIAGTSLGTLALAAGALDDAAAWCLLALVLASFGGEPSIVLLAVGGGLAYALFLFTAGRRLLAALYGRLCGRPALEGLVLPVTLVLLMLCAWFTDRVGIYAVFGAFLLGAAMPRTVIADGARTLRARLTAEIGPLTTALLLPMFFVYSGLNTSLRLIGSAPMLGVALLVLLAAIAGKGIACAAAARLAGETKRDAAAIGALMNARGLMELILLNIGYQRGLITQTLFTVLVVMAIVTTLMAVPLFDRVHGRARRPVEAEPASTAG